MVCSWLYETQQNFQRIVYVDLLHINSVHINIFSQSANFDKKMLNTSCCLTLLFRASYKYKCYQFIELYNEVWFVALSCEGYHCTCINYISLKVWGQSVQVRGVCAFYVALVFINQEIIHVKCNAQKKIQRHQYNKYNIL